ncbi:MAG: hypothetical protein J6X55_12030 [Victivallales bacterium]|nr:hypothetical protein [Victivallales bacterium]
MLKLIESAFLMGLGATSLTVKKAEEFVNKAISDKEITKEEGNQLLKTILDEGKKSEEELKAKIDELISSRGESILTTYKKVQDLEARVAALEAKLGEKA